MKLNGIFKDNMVFQRDREIRVFGTCDEVREGSVCAKIFDGSRVIAESGKCESLDGGFFVCTMPELPAGGPYTLKVSSKSDEITLNNVYVGEVWLAGGQSNMEYPLGRSDGADKAVPSCPQTRIHFYQVPVFDRVDEELLEAEAETAWNIINADTCYNMTGIGYYFMLKVQDYLAAQREECADLHFGVIGCYLGGTSVSSWQSVASLERTPEGRRYLDLFRAECDKWNSIDEYMAAEAAYLDECEVFESKVNEVLKKYPYMTYFKTEEITGPGAWPPPVGPVSMRRPGALFEAMLMRIVPFALRGVIFYQGEEDVNLHSADYAVVFRTMIEQWREVFRDEELPFLFVKLPAFLPSDSPDLHLWEEVQRQQQMVADTVPGAYIVDIDDCGEIGNVHPSNKKTPGVRLAALALKVIYGLDC